MAMISTSLVFTRQVLCYFDVSYSRYQKYMQQSGPGSGKRPHYPTLFLDKYHKEVLLEIVLIVNPAVMDILATLDPNDLFSAKGLVVVITGGGSGMPLCP